ncbi:AAA family ATPase [Candidatus Micrarchaeota archaeon]|nr:AAA family ATPase [Candidatus Micrarchaeota archaeon]
MIDGISLHNWKSHEDTNFKFGRGTNILVGPMGSGKSTVLDALCFALFGNFPALQHKRVKLSEIIMNRPVKKGEARVKVEFTWQSSRYEIERKINSEGSSEARISREGKLLQGPQPQRVNEEVERLLGIDYELFTRAVYSEQNGIDYFLTIGRGERKKQIDELLGISKFEVMRSSLSTVLNRIKGMQDDKRALLGSVDAERLRKEEENATADLKRLEREVQELGNKVGDIRIRKKNAEAALSRMSMLERVYNELSERKGAIARTIENMEKEEAWRISAVSPEEIERADDAEIGRIEEKLREGKKRVSDYAKEIGSTNERIRAIQDEIKEKEELERKISDFKETASEIEGRVNEVEKKINEARGEIGCSKRRISELDELISELRREITKCPVCETPLEENRRKELLGNRERERAVEVEKISNMEKLIGEDEKSLSSMKEKLKAVKNVEDRVKKLRGKEEAEKLSSLLGSVEEKLKKEEQFLKDIEAKRERMRVALEIKKSRMRMEELRKEGADVEKKLGEIKFDKGAFEEKRNEVSEMRSEERGLTEKIEGLRNEMKRVEEIVKGKKEEVERYEKLGKDAEKYGSLYENFALFQNSVSETQAELREELIGAINAAMGEMWSTVYPYADYQGVRLNADEDDYELQLNAGGSWVSVDGIASGGERSSASIVMRMAFAMVLVPNLSWLILDEPTHNLDEEGRKALGKVLNEYVPKIVEQVFVITHDESLKDEASARIYHLWRNKEKNEPTKVESANVLNSAIH